MMNNTQTTGNISRSAGNSPFTSTVIPRDPHNGLSSFYRLNVKPKKVTGPRTERITRRCLKETPKIELRDISKLGINKHRKWFDLMDPDTEDESYMFDSDSEKEYEEVSNNDNTKRRTGQAVYQSCCKTLKLVPISVFHRQLAGHTVSLKYQNLTGDTFKSIAIALLRNETVKSVCLEGDAIGPEEAHHLCEVLQHNDNITELNLSGNNLGTEGLRYIVQAVKKNDTLQKLNLSENGFTEGDARFIKELLMSDNALQELYISKNQFEDKGGKLIAEGLRANSSLKVIDLSWNHIRGDGANEIGMSLLENETLEKLDVSWNGFEIMGCHGLGHGLDQNESLRELNISYNRVNVTGLAKMLEGLKNNNTLKILKLADNPITQSGALLVLKVLKGLSNVEHLDVGNQPVTEEFMELLETIRKDRNLSVSHGKIYSTIKKNEDPDDTMYISGDPLIVLLEFSRMKKICVHDLFISFDTDQSHTITWDEFIIGAKKSRIPVRPRDLDSIIKRIDINQDGEINFSELIIAQKEHNKKATQLLGKGDAVFYKHPIGCVHKELHKWFSDKSVYLKRYKINESIDT